MRFSGSNVIIDFKPLLPPKRLKSRGWLDRLPSHNSRRLHTQPARFIKFAQPGHCSLPQPRRRAMRCHQRPVHCASSILLRKVRSNKHSRGCCHRFSHPPDRKFSLQHVLNFQTLTFSKSHLKNTANNFSVDSDSVTSEEVGLHCVDLKSQDV